MRGKGKLRVVSEEAKKQINERLDSELEDLRYRLEKLEGKKTLWQKIKGVFGG